MRSLAIIVALLVLNAALLFLPHTNQSLVINDFTPNVSPPKTSEFRMVSIRLSPSNLKTLQLSSHHARIEGYLDQEAKEHANGDFCYDNECLSSDFSLRGDLDTHWSEAAKSLRVKLDNKQSWHGMRRFDLIKAQDRYYEIEPLALNLAKILGVSSAKVEFVHLEINQRYQGLYLLKESPNALTWDRDGDSWSASYRARNIWLAKVIFGSDASAIKYGFRENQHVFNPIRLKPNIYIESSGNDDPKLYNRFSQFLNVLEGNNQYQINDYLNLETWASWQVCAMVFGSVHPTLDDNLSILYDSATGKFAPLLNDVLLRALPASADKSLELFATAFSPFKIFEQKEDYILARNRAIEKLIKSDILKQFDQIVSSLKIELIQTLSQQDYQERLNAWDYKRKVIKNNLDVLVQISLMSMPRG